MSNDKSDTPILKIAVNVPLSQVANVNVADLEAAFNAGDEVTPDTLRAKSLAKSRR